MQLYAEEEKRTVHSCLLKAQLQMADSETSLSVEEKRGILLSRGIVLFYSLENCRDYCLNLMVGDETVLTIRTVYDPFQDDKEVQARLLNWAVGGM
jgi:hypothetical protein